MSDQINIEDIVELVRQQEPERNDIIMALQNCSGGYWSRIRFIRLEQNGIFVAFGKHCYSNVDIANGHIKNSLYANF